MSDGFNVFNDSLYLTVSRAQAGAIGAGSVDIRNVAGRWSNVEEWSAHIQNVINLARVYQSNEALTHYYHMEIRRGK